MLGSFWGVLGTIGLAAAQCHAGFASHAVVHHHAGPADTVKVTENNNRFGFRGGALVARDGQGTFFGGMTIEAAYFVGPRTQVGGRMAFSAPSPIPTNFGYEATGPLLRFINLGPDLRYLLRNGRRWRVDALGGPGLNWYYLADHDHQVTSSCGCSGPAAVASTVRPMADVGLGLTYKLSRRLWLTSDLRYNRVLGGAPFGEANLQSQWQLAIALALPAGFAPRPPVAAPGAR